MAFFGLTSLGPQRVFQGSLADTLAVNVFSEEEFAAAFQRVDRDGSGVIERDEVVALMEDVYHGPPPEREVEKFMLKFDRNQDGRVTWEEFRTALLELQAEADERERQGGGVACEYTSAAEFRNKLQRYDIYAKGPRDKYQRAVTAAQELGWERDQIQDERQRHPKVSSFETRFASAMVQSGVYF